MDDGYRKVNVPPELELAMVRSNLLESYSELNYSKRKEFARQVAEAKADNTKQRRIEKIIALLS